MAEKTTIIGERTKVSGNLEGDEDLTVKGRVEGKINLSKTLIVEAGGVVVADVEVKDCVVSGVIVGDVTATDSVQLTQGGRMVGDIKAPRVIIVAGAAFKGGIDMGNLESERPRGKSKVIATSDAKVSRANGPSTPPARPVVVPTMAKPPQQAVAPRIANASGGGRPAPPAAPFFGGKKKIKKK
jgi:cytoskeletal protein CcmA (bactofilin family)